MNNLDFSNETKAYQSLYKLYNNCFSQIIEQRNIHQRSIGAIDRDRDLCVLNQEIAKDISKIGGIYARIDAILRAIYTDPATTEEEVVKYISRVPTLISNMKSCIVHKK